MEPVKWKEFVHRLKLLGFEGPKSGGKHLFMVRGEQKFRVPNPHKNKEIGEPLLSELIRQLGAFGITKDEWDWTKNI
ncbi:MAG: type II toxin-antitoxin system HicA family toxin [Syntrophomonadaceae bacterium]|nr:type II toxin-antitoxin system HicA family toxin [Syntrophomonadaceae bacterium]